MERKKMNTISLSTSQMTSDAAIRIVRFTRDLSNKYDKCVQSSNCSLQCVLLKVLEVNQLF